MKINRLSATFGRLQQQTLELRDGLNILQAPNETGKSTWCAFLAAMLYGVNSRERDRAGFIADKNRFAPWSGAAMSGRLDCIVQGESLRITRETRRQTAPMGEFSAVYAGTGDAVPGLTGQTCGETLLGVSREVFERSAFIRQTGLSITQDAGLERRIAALITTGEEDTSYSEAADTLKKQLNRRRHHKTGLLPGLEADLAEVRRQLEELAVLEVQWNQAQREIDLLAGQEHQLVAELADHDRWDAAQARHALESARQTVLEKETAAKHLRLQLESRGIPENDGLARLRGAIVNLETVRRGVEKAREERDTAMKAVLRAEVAVGASPFAGSTAEGARQIVSTLPATEKFAWWAAALMLLGTGAAYLFTRNLFPTLTLGGSATLAALLVAWLRMRRKQQTQAAVLKKYGAATPEAFSALADAYVQLLEARDVAQASAAGKSAAADSLYATLSSNEQAILLEVRRFAPAAFEIAAADAALRECAVDRRTLAEAERAAQEARIRYETQEAQQSAVASASGDAPAAPPVRSRAAVTAQLDSVRAALFAARSAADRLSGQLHALGDPAVLQAQAAQGETRQQMLEREYTSIALAMEALDAANTTLQNRFSPALGRQAAKIFGELTEGRYTGVVLDRAFHLSAEPAGDAMYRDAGLLSAGAADQLYLATRLAICELVLPEDRCVPIVLDDALANFDDARCAAALRYLKEEAQRRQILLFTCHSREADFFRGDDTVSVQVLTQAPGQV